MTNYSDLKAAGVNETLLGFHPQGIGYVDKGVHEPRELLVVAVVVAVDWLERIMAYTIADLGLR